MLFWRSLVAPYSGLNLTLSASQPWPLYGLAIVAWAHQTSSSKADFVAASRVASMSSMGLFAPIGEVDMKSPPGPSGLHELIGEAIGFALDRGIEHLDRVRIGLVCEHGAFRVQYEAGRLHLRANGCRLNPMQRLGVARARRLRRRRGLR